jgi:diguanylate cyclase (GGDEF)-like protein
MSYLSEITYRRGLVLLCLVLAILIGGTWATLKMTTDYLLNEDATSTAKDWADYLAKGVPDLGSIAAGEQPSAASMAFFDTTRNTNQVFRYVIFNRQGYSQLIADRNKIALVDLSEFSPDAARAAATLTPVIDVSEGKTADVPAYFARAYVAAVVDDKPIAVVAAYVDETEQRDVFYRAFLFAAAALCGLTALSFGIPAVAWYRRTREKQGADRRIHYLAHHDPLTGLYNRSRLTMQLERLLIARTPGTGSVAVHFIDIDYFKTVNDSLGHDGGDFLLRTLASRLQTIVRHDDIVARLGGDEFVVIQAYVESKDEAAGFANRLLAAAKEPIQFNDNMVTSTMSIGIAIAPADGNDPERLLKCSDLALYKAKSDGRNCLRFFLPEMDSELQARMALEKLIRNTAAKNGFVLHYQPVYEIADRHLIGFEALLRLPRPDGTLIAPADFISVAENMQLIDKIGAWVLREACRTAANWPKHLTVAVNLSPAQFTNGDICAIVADALKVAGLEPHRLELEITENLLLGHSDRVLAELRKLKDIGVAIVMDDFGTGYSSLSYLWRFPFDKIKIDRSFVQGFNNSGHDAETVVKTIIALGRQLNMRVTVEGVETAEQAAFLDGADADQVQGYFFGRPVPASDIFAGGLQGFGNAPPIAPALSAGTRPIAAPAK